MYTLCAHCVFAVPTYLNTCLSSHAVWYYTTHSDDDTSSRRVVWGMRKKNSDTTYANDHELREAILAYCENVKQHMNFGVKYPNATFSKTFTYESCTDDVQYGSRAFSTVARQQKKIETGTDMTNRVGFALRNVVAAPAGTQNNVHPMFTFNAHIVHIH